MSYDVPAVAAATTAPRHHPLSPYSRLAGRLGCRRLSALLEELAASLDENPDVDLTPLIRQRGDGVTEVCVTVRTPTKTATVELPA